MSRLDVSNAWRAVLGRIQLVHQRFSIEDFADWLSLNATQQLYALDYAQVERMLQLLGEAGFKRGLDQQHLQQSLTAVMKTIASVLSLRWIGWHSGLQFRNRPCFRIP